MYNSVFLSCFGSSIYTTLGALNRINRILKKVVIWNVVGNASLIIYFKCLGVSYNDTVKLLDDFELTITMFNYSSLLIEDEDYKKRYIKDWLITHIENNKYINKESTLQNVYSKTGFFPCFIVWDSVNKKIVNLNPKTHPELSFIDCVLSCLCGIGTYKHYKMDNLVIKNVFAIDPIPLEYKFQLTEKELDYLYIINKNQLKNADLSSLGPFVDIQNNLLEEYLDRFSCKKLDNKKENILILYSNLIRTHSQDELHNLFDFGNRMCETFLEGQSTFDRYTNELKNIEEQK